MCKNFSLYGTCKYGDKCSFAHTSEHIMVKTEVSVLYKTKPCDSYSRTGYCSYGMRCQFIHDPSEAIQYNQLEEGTAKLNINARTFKPEVQFVKVKPDPSEKAEDGKELPVKKEHIIVTRTGGLENK